MFFDVRDLLVIRTVVLCDFLRMYLGTDSRGFVLLGLGYLMFPFVGLVFAVVRSYSADDLCLFACRAVEFGTCIVYLPLVGYGISGFGSCSRRRFGQVSPGLCGCRLQRYASSSFDRIALINASTYFNAVFSSCSHVKSTDHGTSCSIACKYVVFALCRTIANGSKSTWNGVVATIQCFIACMFSPMLTPSIFFRSNWYESASLIWHCVYIFFVALFGASL